MVKVFEGTPEEFYMDGYMQQNLDIAKNMVTKDFDMVFVIDGSEGCLSGDTLIQNSRGKLSRRHTIKWMFNQFNNDPDGIIPKNKSWDLSIPTYVRSFNGKEIRLHKISNVVYSGKKEVYRLTLENGQCIKATNDHKIMTADGWKELGQLTNNDKVMCDTLHAKNNQRRKVKLYDIQLTTYYHPQAKNKRVEVHRLIYEARMNHLSFLEYMDILLNEEEKAKQLKYIDTKLYDVHHKDGFHYNNSIENLELVSKREHNYKHIDNIYSNFSQGIPTFSKVDKVEHCGVEDTYDIQCEEPDHNFVADGIVVHNSGKSVLAQQVAKYCDPSFDIKRVTFKPEQFTKAIMETSKYQAVIYDEAYTGLSSRATMSLVNKTLIKMLAEIRQKNLFVIVVMPCFFDLDKYVSLWRSRCLIHVYKGKNLERGFFMFYNEDKKKDLFINGKKYYSYSRPKPNFIGRFTNHYTVNEEAYRELKRKSLVDKPKVCQQEYSARMKLYDVVMAMTSKGYTEEQISEITDITTANIKAYKRNARKLAIDKR